MAPSKRLLSNTSSPMLQGDYVYSAKSSGELVCLEAGTGKQVWGTTNVTELKFGASIHLTPNGDVTFLFTDEGNLIIARLTPDGYHEISRVHLLKPTSVLGTRKLAWVPPVYVNRCIFARNDEELICASLAAKPHGLFRGAAKAQAPIIVQFTRVIRNYADPAMLARMIQAAEEIHPEVDFAVHLDHGDEESCSEAIRSGHYSSVMIDASHLPFEQNVQTTRQIVEKAHACGVSVEAELGLLKGIEDDMAVSAQEAILTDPAQAEEFVRRTGCDSLAVAIGTSHGAYKFSGKQRLHFDRLSQRPPAKPEA